jgi:hypothetical protein
MLTSFISEATLASEKALLVPTTPITEKRLYQIEITPVTANIYLPIQYTAIGKYDDASQSDITSQVNWIAVTPSIASFDTEGMATPKNIGTTPVTANLDGITSAEVILNVVPSMVCGHQIGQLLSTTPDGGINDTDKASAIGNCLKIREIIDPVNNRLKWFSSSPSSNVMLNLGYTLNDTNSNSGDTYASMHMETDDIYGPSGGVFARFRQDGDGVILPEVGNDELVGVNGQYDRWCQKLASLKFAGRSNWSRAILFESKALFTFDNPANDSMYPRFGWPTGDGYWSATTLNENFFFVSLSNGFEHPSSPSSHYYAPCVSGF